MTDIPNSGFTVQWGLDAQAGVPFIASGGIGLGIYATGFSGPNVFGVYAEVQQNHTECSDGNVDAGGARRAE